MRPAKFGPGLGERIVAGLLTAAALAPPAWGYVNGGDFHSSLKRFEKTLKAGGWGVHFGKPLPADCDRTGKVAGAVTVVPPDNPDYGRYVNLLVGQALQALPEGDAGKISTEAKRQVARLTREALQNAVAKKQQTIKKGRTGSLRFQVGACAFESYWETNYGGKREIHERKTGLAPFVALKVVEAKGEGERQP
jgi:hypothetical protein